MSAKAVLVTNPTDDLPVFSVIFSLLLMSNKNIGVHYRVGQDLPLDSEDRYDMKEWSQACEEYTRRVIADMSSVALFEVKLASPFDLYLESFPESRRQLHNCSTCAHFLQHAAALVYVDTKGSCHSILFPGKDDPEFKTIPKEYHQANLALKNAVEGKTVSGVAAVTAKQTIGTRLAGNFHHLCWEVPAKLAAERHPAYQVVQHFEMLQRCRDEYDIKRILEVKEWFAVEDLPGKSNVLPCIDWLAKVLAACSPDQEGVSVVQQTNLLWTFANSVPTGFLHSLRSGMASILLQKEQPGGGAQTDEEVQKTYKEAIDPTVFQRKVAPPKPGNLTSAQQLFDKLGIQDHDWPRRFCLLTDLWENANVWQSEKKDEGDWFKESDSIMSQVLQGSCQAITLNKFIKTVLPIAAAMAYQPTSSVPFYAFVTGNKGTYPFLQWHHRAGTDVKENLVSWYAYAEGRKAEEIHLTSGKWTTVSRVVSFPHMWQESKTGKAYSNIDKGYLFVLPEAHDDGAQGGCLFPQVLASVFHPVKSTIEEYNRRALLSGKQEVLGVGLREGSFSPIRIKVHFKSGGKMVVYLIDRWE